MESRTSLAAVEIFGFNNLIDWVIITDGRKCCQFECVRRVDLRQRQRGDGNVGAAVTSYGVLRNKMNV